MLSHTYVELVHTIRQKTARASTAGHQRLGRRHVGGQPATRRGQFLGPEAGHDQDARQCPPARLLGVGLSDALRCLCRGGLGGDLSGALRRLGERRVGSG